MISVLCRLRSFPSCLSFIPGMWPPLSAGAWISGISTADQRKRQKTIEEACPLLYGASLDDTCFYFVSTREAKPWNVLDNHVLSHYSIPLEIVHFGRQPVVSSPDTWHQTIVHPSLSHWSPSMNIREITTVLPSYSTQIKSRIDQYNIIEFPEIHPHLYSSPTIFYNFYNTKTMQWRKERIFETGFLSN